MVDVRKHLALLQGGLLDKPYRQLSVRAVEGFALSSRLRMPLHQATLRTVSEAPLHIEIRHKHCPHHVRAGNMALSFEHRVPVPGNVQIPERLRSGTPPGQLGLVVAEPRIASRTLTSHKRFDFQRVLPRFRKPSHESAVPSVPVPSLGEHACAPLHLRSLCAAHVRTADVCLDHQFLHALRGMSPSNVAQGGMEGFQFSRPGFVNAYASVFPKHAEVQHAVNRRVADEGLLRCCWRELLEVS